MVSGAVSEIGVGCQSGTAPVAILSGAHPAQGKFGSLQDFWSVLGTHGIAAPTGAGELSNTAAKGNGIAARIPAKPVAPAHALAILLSKPIHATAQSGLTVGSATKAGSTAEAKKHGKAADGEVAEPKGLGIAEVAANSSGLMAGVVTPQPVDSSKVAKLEQDPAVATGHRGTGSSRIPDGLVSKQGATSGAASASDKTQPVGSDTPNSGAGHSGGNPTTMSVAGIGLATPQAADAPTAFVTTLLPALDHLASTHSAARETTGHSESATGAGATSDGDGPVGYGGSSGFSEPRAMVANANVLEVGLTGGAHGWLRVRAELGHTGEVTASLVASNAGSAQSLDRQLGAMADYLKSEAVSVGSLTVSASEKSAGTDVSSGSSGGEAGNQSGSSSGNGGNARQQQSFPEWPGTASGSNPEEVLSGISQSMASGGSAIPSALMGSGVGGWLNVRV